MSNKPIAQIVKDHIMPIVTSLGYELVEVEYMKKQNGMNLTIFIDSPEGVDINDCETVHKAIDLPLDELDPTSGKSYTLNVSSPGLDRPLLNDADLNRNINQLVDISTYSKISNKKSFEGQLDSFDSENLNIICDGKRLELPRKNISKITKHISF